MKTLYLMRHAKAAMSSPTGGDHDRPLAPRGVHAAVAVGEHLRDRKARIDLVLCSTATRAAETAELVVKARGEPVPVLERERGLYLCGAHVLLERLHDAPGHALGLMLVAHNPDIHELAGLLCGEASAHDEAALADGYPTGALAVFLFEIAHWRDLEPGSGRLVEYVLPRKLA
jgi:phosphohistidine phosphatase